jgi:hypothetical protein
MQQREVKMPARKAPTRKKTVARRRVSGGYYDVTLRGTFEAHFNRLRGTSAAVAKAAAERQLRDYAAEACNGGSTIVIDKTSEVKTYVPKFEVELQITAATETEARKLLGTLGEKANVKEVYKENVRRGY